MTPWAGAAPTTPLSFVLIPSGKHAAFRDWDAPSLANCTCRWCRSSDLSDYTVFVAKHRADVTQ